MTKESFSGFARLASQTGLYTREKMVKVGTRGKVLSVGLPNETSMQEKRIALTPDAVELLVNNGHEIQVESKAGEGSKFGDDQYANAGAKIIYSKEEIYKADIILKIEPPTLEKIDLIKKGKTLISAIHTGNRKPDYFKALNERKVTALGFELLEDEVGGMPIVRAMSEIAGSTVISIASEYLSCANGGKGIILGGITGVPPTKIVVIGAGTVAEYVARIALGLGAEVRIFDNHLYKLRRIKQTLGHQLYTSTIDTVTLAESLKRADLVIGALRTEKGRARHVVSEEMVAAMKSDSLIIDLSIDQGGCIATSEMTSLKEPVYRKHDIIHYCVPNVASRVAHTATTALSNIFTPILLQTFEEGGIENMIFTHHWFMNGVYTYNGSLTNEHIAQKFGMKYTSLDLLMAARF